MFKAESLLPGPRGIFDAGRLFRAAEKNDLKRVKFTIETENAPATIKNAAKQTIAHIAARHGYFDMLVYILEKEPSVLQEFDSESYTVLHLAIEEGDLKMVKYLIENYKVDIYEESKRGWGTAIHTAVEFGHLDILKYLIEERKGDVNVLGKLGNLPPVFLAVKYQYHDIIEYLIEEKKANLTLVDSDEENILYIIVRKNDLPFMKRILEEKNVNLDINQKNYMGETLVHTAAILNRTNILKYLVEEKHAEIDTPRKRDGMTPLHCAAAKNHYEICKYLIEHGANTQLPDTQQQVAEQKTNDTHLVEYMKNTSVSSHQVTRSSRSISPFSLGSIEWVQGAGRNIIRSRTHSNDSFEQVQSFLVIAKIILNKIVERHSEYPTFLTPQIILQKRMDPVAEETINNIPNF